MTDDPTTETLDKADTPPSTDSATPESDVPETSAEETPTGDEPDDAGISRRDVRYREKLRAAEQERDTLRQNLEAMQRREVERLAADHLTKPAALWTVGVELASLVGDDGTVDPDAVLAATQDAKQQLGLEDPKAKLRREPVVPREGTSVKTGGKSGSWSDAFKR